MKEIKIDTRDTCVIARRLPDGRIQCGRGGRDGVARGAGRMLLSYYADGDAVEYLFAQGQLDYISKPGSHKMCPTGTPFEVVESENDVVNMAKKGAAVYGCYIYETDGEWYYIIPDIINIKIPMKTVLQQYHGSEGYFRTRLTRKVVVDLAMKQPERDPEFKKYLEMLGFKNLYELSLSNTPMFDLEHRFIPVARYYDNWVVVEPDEDDLGVGEIVYRRREEEHMETILWKQKPEEEEWEKWEQPRRYHNLFVRERAIKKYAKTIYGPLIKYQYGGQGEEELLKVVPRWFLKKIEKVSGKREIRREIYDCERRLWDDEISRAILEGLVAEAERKWEEMVYC